MTADELTAGLLALGWTRDYVSTIETWAGHGGHVVRIGKTHALCSGPQGARNARYGVQMQFREALEWAVGVNRQAVDPLGNGATGP